MFRGQAHDLCDHGRGDGVHYAHDHLLVVLAQEKDGLFKVEEEPAYRLCGRILNQIQLQGDSRDSVQARLRYDVGDTFPYGGLIDLVNSERI